MADEIYFLPIEPDFVEKIIVKEKPDGILLSFGGQTALNTGVALFESGILEKYNVSVLGTPVEAILSTEDRDLFARAMKEANLKIPESKEWAETNINRRLAVFQCIFYQDLLLAFNQERFPDQ